MKTIHERLDILEEKMRSENFRENKGLGNEVGYYVFDYEPEDELIVRRRIERLASTDTQMKFGYELIIYDLYELMIQLLKEEDVFEDLLELEETDGTEYVFDTISDSLYYSARIDGASNWIYLWRIMVPIAKPSIFTIILLNALSSWNSFMWPLYVTSDAKSRTLPYGLQVFTTEAASYSEYLMAASTIVVLPMIILFILTRKYIVNGVSTGGLKG